MNFDYTKLEQLLSKLASTRNFHDGSPLRRSLDEYVLLSDYTEETFTLFDDTIKELKRNLNVCSTSIQQTSISGYYYTQILGEVRIFSLVWEIALDKGSKAKKDNNNEGLPDSKYREQNYISDEKVNQFRKSIAKMETLIEQINPDPATEPNLVNDRLSHKQQVILLKQLGVFELPFIQTLNQRQKGILFSHVLNRDKKNSEDYIRYVGGQKTSEATKNIWTDANKKAVNDLLDIVGLNSYKIT